MAALIPVVLAVAPKVKVLVITGEADPPRHFWRETATSIRDALERRGRFDVRINEKPRGLTSAALQGYAALVLNSTARDGPRPRKRRLSHSLNRAAGCFADDRSELVALELNGITRDESPEVESSHPSGG
jgi:hypothetical protein